MTKFVSVYFNGTCDTSTVPEQGKISLAALLAHTTKTDSNNYSFCVNGCGESRDIRDFSVVFSFHLEINGSVINEEMDSSIPIIKEMDIAHYDTLSKNKR